MKKIIFYLISVVCVFLICAVVAGIFLWKDKENIVVDNSKVYRNEQFGFEVRYPKDSCVNGPYINDKKVYVDFQTNCPPENVPGTLNWYTDFSLVFSNQPVEEVLSAIKKGSGLDFKLVEVVISGVRGYKLVCPVSTESEGMPSICTDSWLIAIDATHTVEVTGQFAEDWLDTISFFEK